MRSLATAILAISLFLIPPQASAQNLRLQQVTHAGVVKNVRGNVIQFDSDQGVVRAECLLPSGNQQQLALNEFGATRINVRGRESIQYLKKGMTIRFEADVVRGVRISNPIKQVTLITRHNFTQLGMEQQGNGVPDRRDADAVDDEEADDDDADDDEADDDNARGNRNAAVKMVVTGVVNYIDDEKFRVEIPDTRRGRGPRKITANWGEEPIVRIDAQEMAYIQPEDRITVVGYVIRGLNVMATSVEVEHVNADVAAPQQEADKLPEGQVFPRNDPLEKGFDGNNAGAKNAMSGDANANDGGAKNAGEKENGEGANAVGNNGRKPKKNRPPGRVFKIN